MNLNTAEGMKQAVAWQTDLMRVMKEGAAWAIPAAQTIVHVYPSQKIAMFMPGVEKAPDVVRVYKAMGWTCFTGTVPPPPADGQQSFSA